MSAEDKTYSAEEVSLSLTGYDEIAIEKAFGSEPNELSAQKQMRALAFIIFRREGSTDPEAKDLALKQTQGEAIKMFGLEDEVFPDEPVTEAGKESSPDE